jgi:hypothetical protein
MRTTIIKVVSTVVFIFTVLTGIPAQGPHSRMRTPEERARWQTDWMKKELSLDSAVIAKVYAINLKYAQRMDSLMRSDNTRHGNRPNMRTLMDAKDKELEKVFTAEQFKLYLQKKDQMRQNARENRQLRP